MSLDARYIRILSQSDSAEGVLRDARVQRLALRKQAEEDPELDLNKELEALILGDEDDEDDDDDESFDETEDEDFDLEAALDAALDGEILEGEEPSEEELSEDRFDSPPETPKEVLDEEPPSEIEDSLEEEIAVPEVDESGLLEDMPQEDLSVDEVSLEDFDVEEAQPSSGPQVVDDNMKQQLGDLGYSNKEIDGFNPSEAWDIIDSDTSKKDIEKFENKVQKLTDVYEKKIHKALESAKKSLELLKKRRDNAIKMIDKQTEALAELDEDSSEKGFRRRQALEQRIESLEDSLESIESQISAQEHIVEQIIKSEDGLIDELQEFSESALSTPSKDDDKAVALVITQKTVIIDELSGLHAERESLSREVDRKREKLDSLQKKRLSLFKSRFFDLGMINEIDAQIEAAQEALNRSQAKLDSKIRETLRSEKELNTEQTIERLEQALEDAQEDMRVEPQVPSIEEVREKSKEDIKEEDPGSDAAKKTHFYKEQSQAMKAYVQKVEPLYREFVVQYLGPDIPNDETVEKAISYSTDQILKHTAKMMSLADRYSRNDMYRSAILLAPALYEIAARAMQAVLSQGPVTASTEDLIHDLSAAGFLKEALSLKEILRRSKDVGGQVGKKLLEVGKDVGSKALQKGKELAEEGAEAYDRHQFSKQDSGDRRDFEKKRNQARKNLKILQELESDIKKQRAELESSFKEEQDPQRQRLLMDAIQQTDAKLKAVGERKNVIEQGLKHEPEPGMQALVEKATQSRKNDYQHSVQLMGELTPDLTTFLAMVPDDASLEKELLRHSDRIAKIANKLIQVGFKARKKYPNLPPTIQAFGHIFLSIDDALDRALRTN